VQPTVSLLHCTLAADSRYFSDRDGGSRAHVFESGAHTHGDSSAMHESRLEALLLQQHRTLTPSIAAVIDRFALTSAADLTFFYKTYVLLIALTANLVDFRC